MIPQATGRLHAKVIIQRVGDNIDIQRPDGTEPLNKYHKKDDTDRAYTLQSSDEYAYVMQETERAESVEGGRVEEHLPEIALYHDTIVTSGDRLDFPDGRSFHITNTRDLDAYVIGLGTLDTS